MGEQAGVPYVNKNTGYDSMRSCLQFWKTIFGSFVVCNNTESMSVWILMVPHETITFARIKIAKVRLSM